MCIKLWFRGKPLRFFRFIIMSTTSEKVYYAVGRGKEVGIYESWKECKAQTDGFCNAKYRKFYNLDEAKDFVNFWKSYSSPVKDANETADLVSTVLYQKGSFTNREEIFQNIKTENCVNSFNVEENEKRDVNNRTVLDAYPHTLSLAVVRNAKSKSRNDKEIRSSQGIVKTVQPRGREKQLWMCSPLSNVNEVNEKSNKPVALNSQNSTLDDYSNVFSTSKPFLTSTQETVIKHKVVNDDYNNFNENSQSWRGVTGMINQVTKCLNVLESGFKVVTMQNPAESQRLKNMLKTITRRICTYTNTNVNPQMEDDADFDKICETIKTENGQMVGTQAAAAEQELTPSHHLQSPSRTTHVHVQCSSPHSTLNEGRLTQSVDVLALNLRLDSFERRFDCCLKEVGGIASEISHLRTEIKELKETIKSLSNSSNSGLSPKKGRDGLMQTTLSFGPGSPNKVSTRPYASHRDFPDSGEPEQKRGRTLKRKLSRADSLSEDNIDNLISTLKPETVDLSSFTVDDDDFVEVYTDGSALSNGKQDAKAGIGIWFGDDHPLNVAEPVAGPATSITAEIQAARVALQLAIRAGVRKLKIHTDSEFLINCATKWIHRWKKNGWTLRNGGPVKNRKELEKLDNYASQIQVQWEKVAAHSKIKGNETADRLANQGAARYER